MFTAQKRQDALDLLGGKHDPPDLRGGPRRKARSTIEQYLAEKAGYPAGTFDARIEPIYRVLSELDPSARTEAVSWPGQSGHPGSRHYRDQVDRHLNGEYYTVPFDWDEVTAQATSETRLLPAPWCRASRAPLRAFSGRGMPAGRSG